jgi:hypothetical protein
LGENLLGDENYSSPGLGLGISSLAVSFSVTFSPPWEENAKSNPEMKMCPGTYGNDLGEDYSVYH